MLPFSESFVKSNQKKTNKQVNSDNRKCEKKFMTSKKLNKHEEIKQSTKKTFSCDKCKLSYSRREHLNRHLLTHRSEKIYCEKCGYSTFWKWNFDKHKCLHRGIKNCGSCEGCLSEECRVCINCRDKLKFGGANKIKKKCIQQKCKNVGQ